MKIRASLKLLAIIVLLLPFVWSCDNSENEFEDFNYSTTYFAYQYPVRTLVLGETEYYDTTNDRNHRFEIKASMGGVYENKKDVSVEFEVDKSLLDGLYLNATKKLEMLPSTHFEAIKSNSFKIPSGSFNGGFTVQLTDAFFDDPLSYSSSYVLPVRILKTTTDSVLTGKAVNKNNVSVIPSIAEKWGVDPRIAGNWEIKPKNFTIFIVKYINKYHGTYLRRGAETDMNTNPNARKGYGWENKYIEKTNYTPKLLTCALNKLQYDDRLVASAIQFKALLEIKNDNSIVIETNPLSAVDIEGTGKYVEGKEEWGGKKRIALYLDYNVKNRTDSKIYTVKDTLVFRDNGVAIEEYSPLINFN